MVVVDSCVISASGLVYFIFDCRLILYMTKETIEKSEDKKEERGLGRAKMVLFHRFYKSIAIILLYTND